MLSQRYSSFRLFDVAQICLLLIPGLALLATTGDVSVYVRWRTPDGQVLYILSKLVGLYAFLFLWMQVMYGLLGRDGLAAVGLRWRESQHRQLGIAVVILLVSHAALFVLATTLRTGSFAYKLLLPTLVGPYYPVAISLGLIGAAMIVLAAAAALLRTRLVRMWHWTHRLSLPAFLLAFIHSLLIGSEVRVGTMLLFHSTLLVMVLMALGYRASIWWNERSSNQ